MVMPNDDLQLLALTRRYVIPGRPYMKFQGWNLRQMSDVAQSEFGERLGKTAQDVEDEGLARLLSGDWRAKITASWMIAMSSRDWFEGLLGRLLLNGRDGRAALGYVLALTSFGRAQGVQCLRDYVRRGAESNERGASYEWAIAGWKYRQNSRTTPSREGSSFILPEDGWMDSLPSPPEAELISFLCGFVDRFGEKSVRADSRFDPQETFAPLSECSMPGGETWGIVPDEGARMELDRRFTSHPGVTRELRAAVPLAVAADGDFCTALYGLNPAAGAGRWVVSKFGGGIMFEVFAGFDSAVARMSELSHG
ncbi:DUF6000 family protein [Streptomyces tubbatahanensis]|uniref:DUF6000 family protein n=1 Tax=Streptomyces tubbatahanensis TaxID=2923272 RepID=A0ABY3XS05_9ACTN|nr:DUF6000 family protein [Streptomyces tubbatahanensis]UNS97259.1 DUF6000 family protein [Streptomyces tubbatahanensis]